MDKETLLSKMKSKLGNTQLSDRSVESYVVGILPTITDDSIVTDAYLETHVGILRSFEGQYRHDLATGIEDWKKQNPLNPPTPPVNQPSAEVAEMQKQMAQMLQSMTEMQNQFKAQQTEQAKNAVRTSVVEKLRKEIRNATGEDPNNFVFRMTTSNIAVEADSNVDDIVKNLTNAYNANLKEAGIETSAPSFGGGTGNEDNPFGDFFKQKALEGKFPTAE